jgi:hypothetical protein
MPIAREKNKDAAQGTKKKEEEQQQKRRRNWVLLLHELRNQMNRWSGRGTPSHVKRRRAKQFTALQRVM